MGTGVIQRIHALQQERRFNQHAMDTLWAASTTIQQHVVDNFRARSRTGNASRLECSYVESLHKTRESKPPPLRPQTTHIHPPRGKGKGKSTRLSTPTGRKATGYNPTRYQRTATSDEQRAETSATLRPIGCLNKATTPTGAHARQQREPRHSRQRCVHSQPGNAQTGAS